MAFRNWLGLSKTRSAGRHSRRGDNRRASRRRPTPKLRMELLEDRLALSGFGPEDGAYLVEPWIGGYRSVQIQPDDQKIVAAGNVSDNTDLRIAIARYDTLGNLDSTYGSGGPSLPPLSGVSAPALGPADEAGLDLVLQPNGKAVVSGYETVNASFAAARFNADGTVDSSFGSGGLSSIDVASTFFNPAMAVGLQSTGKVVLAGFSYPVFGNFQESAAIARVTTGGAIDSGNNGFGQKVGNTALGYI